MSKKKRSTKEIGDWGEAVAEEYLLENGYEVIGKNVYTPFGELDLVTRKDSTLHIVEVKTRLSDAFGYPEQAVNERKIIHLVESTQHYLQEHSIFDYDWQIDIVSVQANHKLENIIITYFENAITS